MSMNLIDIVFSTQPAATAIHRHLIRPHEQLKLLSARGARY